MKRIFFSIFIFALFLGGLVSITLVVKQSFVPDPRIPTAKQGELDLTRWDFEQRGYLRLNGAWEFYPGKLLKPGAFDQIQNIHGKEYINVPSPWESKRISGVKRSPFGVATYRLRIRLDVKNPDQEFGIKTSLIRLSNSIFVDGFLLESSGKPAPSRREYVAGNRPYIVHFRPKGPILEVVIWVANFDYTTGAGLIGALYFGTKEEIQSLRDQALAFDWIMITGFLLIGFLFISFFMQQTSDLALLYLGLNCWAQGFYAFTHGEKTILWVLPHLSFLVINKIQYYSATAFSIFLVLYISSSFRSIASKTVNRILLSAGFILAGLGVFLSMKAQSHLDFPQGVLGSAAMLYTIYLLIRGTFLKLENSGYLILAALSILLNAIINFTNWGGLIDLSLIPPVEPFVFILSLAFLHSERSAAAFKKVAELSQSLAAADRIKDEFLAKTSHEFRTPLTGIMNLSETLMDGAGGKLTKFQEDNVKMIRIIARRLDRLVNDIVDLVKIQNRELKVKPVPLDIKPLVQVMLGFFRYTSVGKNIEFREKIPDQLPFIWVDEDRLKQILYNLLDNAVKFTEAGKVEVAAAAEAQVVKIWVEDSGPGIPEEILAEIFQPYRRIPAANRENPAGIGLGLTIVQELVELHQGQVWAENCYPGARFGFTLPAVPRALEQTATGQETLSFDNPTELFELETPCFLQESGAYTLLAANQDPASLRLLINAFSLENYNIIAVKNGLEALEQLEKHPDIDLMVLDLMMPGASGYEVCKKVREKYTLAELPVLILTTANQTLDMTASYEAGANDFLAKPYEVSHLKLKIRSLIMMKQSAQDAKNMEVAFLQAQLKPHFLFNTFNTIMSLSYKEIERAREVIANLADFLRESFDFSNAGGMVQLEKELALVRAYLEIEKARYRERLLVEFHMENTEGVMLPPITLQTIVENAVKHGIGPKIEGGVIRIRGQRFMNHYLIYVEDNGQGMGPEKLAGLFRDQENSTGVGLKNVQRRMVRYFGGGITMKSVPGEGTRVELRIPVDARPMDAS